MQRTAAGLSAYNSSSELKPLVPVMVMPRILALVCCLPLALPPGWCQVALRAAAPRSGAGEQAPPLCQHCRPEAPQPTSGGPGQSARCCCSDRYAVAPHSVVPSDESNAVAALLPVQDTLRHALWSPAAAGPQALLSYPPLHVLHCVWRC